MALESSKIKIKFERLLFSKCFWNGHLRGATKKNANSEGAHWRTLVRLISNLNYIICNWKIDFCRSFEFEKKIKLALVWMSNICTDKRTDVWSWDFIIWKIDLAFWAVVWAGLWNKRVWADFEAHFLKFMWTKNEFDFFLKIF